MGEETEDAIQPVEIIEVEAEDVMPPVEIADDDSSKDTTSSSENDSDYEIIDYITDIPSEAKPEGNSFAYTITVLDEFEKIDNFEDSLSLPYNNNRTELLSLSSIEGITVEEVKEDDDLIVVDELRAIHDYSLTVVDEVEHELSNSFTLSYSKPKTPTVLSITVC